MNRLTLISILIAAGIIVAAFSFSNRSPVDAVPENNVVVEDGVQIVEIRARGGYIPEKSIATAGMPTKIRFITSGTFDCSTIVRIPSLDITKNLQPTGSLDIDIGIPETGVFQGTCGMGMYPFEIDFQ